MDNSNLIKLAHALRAYAAQIEDQKQQKLASITLAASGLELLRRKLTR